MQGMDRYKSSSLGIKLTPRVDECVNIYLLDREVVSFTLPSKGVNQNSYEKVQKYLRDNDLEC